MRNLSIDSTVPKSINYNGQKVKTVIFDNVVVWRADMNLFPDARGTLTIGKSGVNATGVVYSITNDAITLSCANNGTDEWRGRNVRCWVESQEIDFSDFEKLKITGEFTLPQYYTWGYVGVGISSKKLDFKSIIINNSNSGGVQNNISNNGTFDLYGHTLSGDAVEIDVSGINGKGYIYFYCVGGYYGRTAARMVIKDATLS